MEALSIEQAKHIPVETRSRRVQQQLVLCRQRQSPARPSGQGYLPVPETFVVSMTCLLAVALHSTTNSLSGFTAQRCKGAHGMQQCVPQAMAGANTWPPPTLLAFPRPFDGPPADAICSPRLAGIMAGSERPGVYCFRLPLFHWTACTLGTDLLQG